MDDSEVFRAYCLSFLQSYYISKEERKQMCKNVIGSSLLASEKVAKSETVFFNPQKRKKALIYKAFCDRLQNQPITMALFA